MILLTLAVYLLLVIAYVARPGRRAGQWLLAATILLPFALLALALNTMKVILIDNFNNARISRTKLDQTV